MSTWRLLLKSIHIDVKTNNVARLPELHKSCRTPVWRVWEIQHTDVQAPVIDLHVLKFAIFEYLKTCLKVNTRWCEKQQHRLTFGTQQIIPQAYLLWGRKLISHTNSTCTVSTRKVVKYNVQSDLFSSFIQLEYVFITIYSIYNITQT